MGIGTTIPDGPLCIMDNIGNKSIGGYNIDQHGRASLKIFQYLDKDHGKDRDTDEGTSEYPTITLITHQQGVGNEQVHVGGVIQFIYQSRDGGTYGDLNHYQKYATIYGGRKEGWSTGELIFHTSTGVGLVPRMTINDIGVGIGITDPQAKLHVKGGDIIATGDITAFSTNTSDKRLKTNINTIENAVEIVQQLRGVRFNWNEEARKINEHVDLEKKEIGVIAQEIEEHLPEVVKKGLSNYKAIRYEKITPVLIEAIKEQQQQIRTQQQQINAQQQQINEILNRLNHK